VKQGTRKNSARCRGEKVSWKRGAKNGWDSTATTNTRKNAPRLRNGREEAVYIVLLNVVVRERTEPQSGGKQIDTPSRRGIGDADETVRGISE